MNVRLPRHRPASLRRVVPVLTVLVLGAGVWFDIVGRPSSPPAPVANKPKTATQVSLQRATAAPEQRKQRARVERRAAPESKV